MIDKPTYENATDILMDAFKHLFPNVRFVEVENLSDDELRDIELENMDDGEWE